MTWKPLFVFKAPESNYESTLKRDQFHQLIEYERLRADRTGSRFTLVIVRLDLDLVAPTTFRRFLAIVHSHLRDTDYIGWLSDGKIGILLPDTTISGAQTFIKNLHVSTNSFQLIRSFGISMYPRIGNLAICLEDEENDGFYATYDKKIEAVFLKPIPSWKRFLDVFFSLSGVIFLMPVLSFISLGILFTDRRPILHFQERVGQGGVTFKQCRFRTLKLESDYRNQDRIQRDHIKSGCEPLEPEKRDPCFIPGGYLLRRLDLDVLPGLWNVLSGRMSLIGPNPCRPFEAELYLHWHKRRFDYPPGLISPGLFWKRAKLSFKDRVRLDLRYSESTSLIKDLGYVLLVGPAFLFKIVRIIRDSFTAARTIDANDCDSSVAEASVDD